VQLDRPHNLDVSKTQSRSARQAICVPTFSCRRIKPFHRDPHPSGQSDQPGESIRQSRPLRRSWRPPPVDAAARNSADDFKSPTPPSRPLHRLSPRRLPRRAADDGVSGSSDVERRPPVPVTLDGRLRSVSAQLSQDMLRNFVAYSGGSPSRLNPKGLRNKGRQW
jgi:hypothetical protein